MTKNFIDDQGDVIYYDEDVWYKTGTTTTKIANASMGPGDVANLSGYTFVFTDAQGRDTYTAQEMAVAEYITGVFSASLPYYTWTTVMASAPYDGVARCYNSFTGNDLRIRVNNIEQAYAPYNRKYNAYPLNVRTGDNIEMNAYSGIAYVILIPFVYP